MTRRSTLEVRAEIRLPYIPLPYYSDAMISEFTLLSEKIDQLALLTQSLRRENAALRTHAVAVTAENAVLSARMQEAQERVMALMEKFPDSPTVLAQDEDAP